MELLNSALAVVGFLFVSLLMLNAWFIKRLVHKLDTLSEVVSVAMPTQQGKIDGLEKTCEGIKKEVDTLVLNLKEVTDLKVRVGVLEYATKVTN
jgi:cell division protein FtsB